MRRCGRWSARWQKGRRHESYSVRSLPYKTSQREIACAVMCPLLVQRHLFSTLSSSVSFTSTSNLLLSSLCLLDRKRSIRMKIMMMKMIVGEKVFCQFTHIHLAACSWRRPNAASWLLLNERSPPPIRPTQGGPVITHIHLTIILLMMLMIIVTTMIFVMTMSALMKMIIVMKIIRMTMVEKKVFY